MLYSQCQRSTKICAPGAVVNSSVLMNNRPLFPLDDLREADQVMQREAVSEPQACPDLVTTYGDGRCLAA